MTSGSSTTFGFGTVRGEASGTCTLLGPEGPDGSPNLWAFSCAGVAGAEEVPPVL